MHESTGRGEVGYKVYLSVTWKLKEDVYYCACSNIPIQLFKSPVAFVDGSTLLIWGWPIVSNGGLDVNTMSVILILLNWMKQRLVYLESFTQTGGPQRA